MKKLIFTISLILSPVLVFAEDVTFASVVYKIYENLFLSVSSLLVSIVFLFFLFSIVKFMLAEGEQKSKAKDSLGWAVIAIFVLFSIWGLVALLNGTIFGSREVSSDGRGVIHQIERPGKNTELNNRLRNIYDRNR